MSFVNFYQLNESEVLNASSLLPGSIICCKDSTNIYMVPVAGTKPIKMSDVTAYITESARANLLAPINGKQYFCYDTGKMWIYYNSWVCLNDISSDIDAAKQEIKDYINNTVIIDSKYSFENPLTLNDNTEYRLSDISNLVLIYPEGNFEVWMRISLSSTETINISFPDETKYIGEIPNFNNGETWEISIKDAVAVCWRIE